jgi:hypothetical protein
MTSTLPSERGILVKYLGGLGNQIWMVVAGYVASKVNNCPLYLPENPIENNKHNRFQQDYRNTIFKYIGQRIDIPLDQAVAFARNEHKYAFHYCPGFQPWSPSTNTPPGTILTTYYQYYPPLADFQNEIRALLLKGLSEQIDYINFAFQPKSTDAFLHIRRGDYLNLPNFHYIQPLDYYRYCIEQLLQKNPNISRIFVFSDDPSWVHRHAFFQNPLFKVVDIPNELESLALMSQCTGGAICANSTFSWWGAFLGAYGNSAPIFVPERWIAEKVVILFPKEWIQVKPETYTITYPNITNNTNQNQPITVFATLTDSSYFEKAKRTIRELWDNGKWRGDIVLITVDFFASTIDPQFLKTYNIQEYPVNHIHTDTLVAKLRETPIKAMPDNRHFNKLTQWDKFYSFSPFFKRWDRVVFLDAGIRVLDSVKPLLDLPYENSFLAPDDSEPYDNGNRFKCQLDLEANPQVLQELVSDFSQEILDQNYFLNCMYVYDTKILDLFTMKEMEIAMNKYPISLCNEMGIMNLFLNFRLGLWKPFPQRTSENKYLFGWNERNYRENPTWESFHFMKYPATI